MPRKQKITEEQVNQYLSQGLSQREIAGMFNMQPAAMSTRIKKMRAAGTLKVEKGSALPAGISKMDTVVRRSDRKWFRVVDEREGQAVLKGIASDQYGHNDRTGITVSMKDLAEQFEKREYPQVKCYIDPDLIESKEEEPMSEEKENAMEVVNAAMEDKSGAAPQDEDYGKYIVSRKYLQRIDSIISAVDPQRATGSELELMNQLISRIVIDGVQGEIDGEAEV